MSISHPTNRIDMFSSCFCTEKWKNASSSTNIKDYFVLDKKATLGDNILIRFCPNNIFKHFLQSVRENNWHKCPLWKFSVMRNQLLGKWSTKARLVLESLTSWIPAKQRTGETWEKYDTSFSGEAWVQSKQNNEG